MNEFKCGNCGAIRYEVDNVVAVKCMECDSLECYGPLKANKADGSKVPCSDRVMPRFMDKMHIDFERYVSSNLNWPIERTGSSYHDEKTDGAWKVFKFAKVA